MNREGRDLWVTLVLFGFASHVAEAAAEALVLGLRGGLSVPGATGGLEISDRTIDAAECWSGSVPTPPPGTRSRAVLVFRTPFALRSGDGLKGSADGLVVSLGNRIAGLARWQDCAVETDWRALAAHARSLTLG